MFNNKKNLVFFFLKLKNTINYNYTIPVTIVYHRRAPNRFICVITNSKPINYYFPTFYMPNVILSNSKS